MGCQWRGEADDFSGGDLAEADAGRELADEVDECRPAKCLAEAGAAREVNQVEPVRFLSGEKFGADDAA